MKRNRNRKRRYNSGGYLEAPSPEPGGIPAIFRDGSGPPIELEGGEYIINAQTVDALGIPFLDQLNSTQTSHHTGGFQAGELPNPSNYRRGGSTRRRRMRTGGTRRRYHEGGYFEPSLNQWIHTTPHDHPHNIEDFGGNGNGGTIFPHPGAGNGNGSIHFTGNKPISHREMRRIRAERINGGTPRQSSPNIHKYLPHSRSLPPMSKVPYKRGGYTAGKISGKSPYTTLHGGRSRNNRKLPY